MSNGGGARTIGRYVLHEEFASGGMASVHFGRLVAEVGFTRTVAIKRLHPQHAKDPAFVGMLLDEARVAARIRHPNVAPILDVVAEGGEVFLVLEYVHGESLAMLLRAMAIADARVPLAIGSAIVAGALHGLAAAHGATSERGEPLGIVHRDVSPENILVGVDGAARVLDFGVALAQGRSQVTREGGLKGKLGYMAPELLEGAKATPLSDVYSTGVVLWETLVGQRLYTGEHEGAILAKVLRGDVPRPSELAQIPRALDQVVMCAMSRSPGERFPSAEAFARALERALPPAGPRDVATFVTQVAAPTLSQRAARIAIVEAGGIPPEALAPVSPGGERTAILVVAPPPQPGVDHTAILGQPGELTERSVARQRARNEARRGGAVVASVVALLACGGIVALAARALGGSGETKADAQANGTATASSGPDVAPPPPPAASTADAAPSATTAPPATASAAPSPVTSRVEPATSPGRAAPPGVPSPTGKRAKPGRRDAACDPPYTVDERGIHHYKPNCL